MNIFSNFVPNKLVTFGDSNPPWMNEFIKNKIKWKHQIYKTCIKMVVKTVFHQVSRSNKLGLLSDQEAYGRISK